MASELDDSSGFNQITVYSSSLRDMNQFNKPGALILVSTNCPHCHTLEKLLHERMESGSLDSLEIVNVERSPEVAQQYGVRSVPWLQLGEFVFDEALTPTELDGWIKELQEGGGKPQYISYLLEHGKLNKAIEWIDSGNATLKSVVAILCDPDAKINVRVGVGAILEHFENTSLIKAVVPDLTALLEKNNSTVKIDACHYLSLTHSRDAIEPLKRMLNDEDQQVRQVAQESIEAIMDDEEL